MTNDLDCGAATFGGRSLAVTARHRAHVGVERVRRGRQVTRNSARSAQNGVEEGIGFLWREIVDDLVAVGRVDRGAPEQLLDGKLEVLLAGLALGKKILEADRWVAAAALHLGLSHGPALSHHGDGREMATTTKARNRSPGPSPLAPIISAVAGSISPVSPSAASSSQVGPCVAARWPLHVIHNQRRVGSGDEFVDRGVVECGIDRVQPGQDGVRCGGR